jgi:phage shock protein C
MTPEGTNDLNEHKPAPQKEHNDSTTEGYRYKGPSAQNAVKAVKKTPAIDGGVSFLACLTVNKFNS